MKDLTNLTTIFRREMAAYFNAAIASIFIIVFVLINGGLFMTQFFLIGRASMQPFFAMLPFMLAVFLPAVSMRLWAEEKRGNTLELLLTFPMAPHELVIGKFLASFVFYLVALAGTLTIPVMIQFLGNPDMGAIFGGYIGSALLGALFLAAGIFVSGLVRDQIVAFILSMLVCFGLHLIGTDFLAMSIDGWVPGFGTFLAKYVGTTNHFASFAKGVIDSRDVLYFLIGTALFLVLNGFWIEGRMRPKGKTIFSTAVVICAGIFLMGNWLLSGIPLGRFDLTEGHVYTVSPSTKTILRDLKAPVTAKLYISPAEKMPTGMKTLEQEIVGKLDELRVAAKGKFEFKIFHMEAANIVEPTEEGESFEQSLQAKGIQPFQVQSVESDEVGVRLIYASLSLAYKEKPEEIIPRMMPETLYELEYLIVSKIFRMTLSRPPVIALVAPYQEKRADPQVMALLAQLGTNMPAQYRDDDYEFVSRALEYEGYEVARIRLNEEEPIPENARTLIILEPSQLDDRQRFEINRFLVEGGSLFLGIQQYEFDYEPSGGRLQIYSQDKKPGINALIETWGFSVNPNILADRQNEVISLSGGAQLGPFSMAVPVKAPIQIIIPPSGMNEKMSITARLSSLFYLWGSALRIDEGKTRLQELEVDTLLHSSDDSWVVPRPERPMSGRELGIGFAREKGPFPVMIFARGQFLDAYAGEAVPAWPADLQMPAGMNAPDSGLNGLLPAKNEASRKFREPAPGKLILVGASSFFKKQLFSSGGHHNLLLNCADVLTLGDELVNIRSKTPIDRSIGRVSAGKKVFWRFFITLLVPAVIAFLGFGRVFLRRQSKNHYLKTLKRSES